MTMVPAENLSKQQHHHHHLVYSGYGGCGGGLMSRIQGYDYSGSSEACLGSDLVVVVNNNNDKSMAEDESRTNSLNEAASSSKDNQEDHNQRDERWLQLSIGTHTTSHDIKHGDHHVDQTVAARRGGLIELDLLPGGVGVAGSSQQARASSIASTNFHGSDFRPPPRPLMNIAGATGYSTSLFFQQGSSSTFPHHQEINWAFRPVPQNIALASSSSSSSLMPFGSYFSRPFQAHTGMDVAGPSSDFRIIDPPRRPQSGIWFMLLASQNQAKEPFLPQISKSYLRIKDGRMTVRLLIKYLVNKLRLDSESEIEITCRGQQLLPFLTLQHVRDNIWSPRYAVTLLPDSSTSDHVMVLHYARSA